MLDSQSAAPAQTLADLCDIAHLQCDVLWDVVALLEAVVDVTSVGNGATEEEANRMRRITRVATERTKGVIDAFSPYI